MGDLTRNFSLKEFACPYSDVTPINMELVYVLQDLRTVMGDQVIITSGYRTVEHNKKVGGAKGSFHLLGMAADLVVKDRDIEDAYIMLDNAYPERLGLILHKTFLHVDIRLGKYRKVH